MNILLSHSAVCPNGIPVKAEIRYVFTPHFGDIVAGECNFHLIALILVDYDVDNEGPSI
jgi:hypothetical protein